MKIKIKLMAVLVPAILFGGIAVSMAAGAWSATTDKQPATYVSGEFADEYNPADIRGSYTFEDIASLFGINLNVLHEAFGIPEGTSGMKTKDLEDLYGEYDIGSPLKDGSGDAANEDAPVNGSTTFAQLLDAGISREDIENIIGSPLPPLNQTVKDYCIAQSLTFSEIKDRLNALAG